MAAKEGTMAQRYREAVDTLFPHGEEFTNRDMHEALGAKEVTAKNLAALTANLVARGFIEVAGSRKDDGRALKTYRKKGAAEPPKPQPEPQPEQEAPEPAYKRPDFLDPEREVSFAELGEGQYRLVHALKLTILRLEEKVANRDGTIRDLHSRIADLNRRVERQNQELIRANRAQPKCPDPKVKLGEVARFSTLKKNGDK